MKINLAILKRNKTKLAVTVLGLVLIGALSIVVNTWLDNRSQQEAAHRQQAQAQAQIHEVAGDALYRELKYDAAVKSYEDAKRKYEEAQDEVGLARIELRLERALYYATFEDYEVEGEGTPYVPGQTEPGR